jgi:hypothetical protein
LSLYVEPERWVAFCYWLFLWFHCIVQAQSKATKVFERKQTLLNPGLVKWRKTTHCFKQSVWYWRPLRSGFRWPELVNCHVRPFYRPELVNCHVRPFYRTAITFDIY